MSKLLWIFSAAAVAISMPMAAEAQGKGKGAGKPGHSAMAKGKGQKGRDWQARKGARARIDRQVDGVADYRDRFIDRNRDGIDDRQSSRYAGANCPPGLAKKTPACVPPGQARRLFSEGQRVPSGFNNYVDYDDLPLRYRENIPSQYGSDLYRYIQRDDSLYVVDRRTQIVSEIINLLR